MDFRIELFVADLDRSIRFYELALGFTLERREQDYASMRRGQAVLGLGVVTKLPPDGPGPGFTQTRQEHEERVPSHRGPEGSPRPQGATVQGRAFGQCKLRFRKPITCRS